MSHDRHNYSRAGFALPATLLAMFVIGAILTGGFYVSAQEHDVSVSTDLGSRALLAAEYGIEERMARWKNSDLEHIPVGTVDTFGRFNAHDGTGGDETYMAYVLALAPDSSAYIIQSEGRVVQGRDTATRRIARLVSASRTELPYKSAMTVYGEFDAGGNSLVNGADQCAAADSVPGVMAADTSLVTGIQKNPHENRIMGDPPVDQDPNLLTVLEAFDVDPFRAAATLKYPSGADPSNMAPSLATESGVDLCDTGDASNWGEPLDSTHSDHVAECAEHYPVIHVAGDMKLTTGRGQGVLIVDGDLELAGNFEFTGVVIVMGSFENARHGAGHREDQRDGHRAR